VKTLVALTMACSVLAVLPARAAGPTAFPSLAELEAQARRPVTAVARVPLAAASAESVRGLYSFEPPSSGRVPNYLRALAGVKPPTAKAFAHLLGTFTYAGNLAPALKLAMALRIAQINRSPYAVTHLERLLQAVGADGDTYLSKLRANQLAALAPGDRLALRWAELQTTDIHGMSDDEFRQLRGYYADSDIVELTFTVSVFNYFTRLVDALGLPVEPWVLDQNARPAPPPVWTRDRNPPRVSLITDDEMAATGKAAAAARRQAASTAGVLNAQRAMLRVPALADAWNEFSAITGPASVGREIMLQVSFAVSMANGCRYCTMHQVLFLRRLGVDPTKLLAMEKDDTALTPREKAAVVFARKLTATPWAISDGDYAALRREFQEQGALEVLLRACTFSFMNRFTDGLNLPSEDEAIQVYQEVYGHSFKRK
jgi:AhpD family alkylhydroperoxidase